MPTTEFVDVTSENVERTGFFCMMSKKKSEGYQRKLAWLRNRFDEGMRIKMLPLPLRGYIEYLPGESAWRAVNANGYMFIHCLWVVGKTRKQGYARQLLNSCIEDAQSSGMKGVAMLTSEKVWLIGKKLFLSEGFEIAETADPAFSLVVKKFGKHESPSLAGDWEKKAAACGRGLTVFYSDQCPYIPDAVANALDAAKEAGVRSNAVHLESRQQIMDVVPSPYGIYSMVLNGKMLAYHYLLKKDLMPLLESA